MMTKQDSYLEFETFLASDLRHSCSWSKVPFEDRQMTSLASTSYSERLKLQS